MAADPALAGLALALMDQIVLAAVAEAAGDGEACAARLRSDADYRIWACVLDCHPDILAREIGRIVSGRVRILARLDDDEDQGSDRLRERRLLRTRRSSPCTDAKSNPLGNKQ